MRKLRFHLLENMVLHSHNTFGRISEYFSFCYKNNCLNILKKLIDINLQKMMKMKKCKEVDIKIGLVIYFSVRFYILDYIAEGCYFRR